MSPYVESLRIEEGRIFHVEFHNRRMNATRQELFGVIDKIDLRDWIDPAGYIARTKCRVLYKETVEQVEYQRYQLRTIRTLRLVNSDTIDYRYKTADRSELDKLAALRGDADEILIVRHGLLTDTSFANIALWNGTAWITPATPLLQGTHRAALLEKGELVLGDIPVSALSRYERIRIFNAMIGFGEIELPVTNLIRY
ncbi:MAG: aminotransferase class IV family protein [Tannerellaceae bacterium]|nr:aminotransferase class IV family protein [Tannerellaceae bacterium]